MYVFVLGVAAMIVTQEVPLSMEYSSLTFALLSVVLVQVIFVLFPTYNVFAVFGFVTFIRGLAIVKLTSLMS